MTGGVDGKETIRKLTSLGIHVSLMTAAQYFKGKLQSCTETTLCAP